MKNLIQDKFSTSLLNMILFSILASIDFTK
jgi:hypothetical protein